MTHTAAVSRTAAPTCPAEALLMSSRAGTTRGANQTRDANSKADAGNEPQRGTASPGS